MTAPPPALIPIDPQALEVALKNVRHAIMEGNPEAIVDTVWVSDIETAVDHIDCALAAITGGGDAG
jgi:hypothetical protein